MNMTENANLIEGLRQIGFTDSQIADLMLMVEGRIDIDEWVKRFKENKAD
ncbi:MAG: hypothetical protein J6N76_02400 [Lachnospiraceae bacterium]|nr:hypothetical protein [Lachnospiraceae bacterium]